MSGKILLTGATGFVGQAIMAVLQSNDLKILGRRSPAGFSGEFIHHEIGSCNSILASFFENVDVVIHAAALVASKRTDSGEELAAFRKLNTEGTLSLAKQAASSGVRRFIFISTVKVNGESTTQGSAFKYNDTPAPEDAYAQSKFEAEEGLIKIAAKSNMDVVIIRPPLVYGPGVKANFASMMKLASRNLPLPLGSIKNKRSLVGIDNLVDLILKCVDHPNAANQVFMVSDDCDVSTSELLRAMTIAAGKKPCLVPFPMFLIRLIARLTGKKAIEDRLCGSLQVDITYTKKTLNWVPPVAMEQGIARCFQ